MKFPVDFLREHWKLMLIVFGILLLLGGLFGGLLPLVNLGGIILILGIASSLVLPGKEKETPEPRAGKSKVVPAKGGKAEGAKSFPAKYIVIALVIIAVLVLSQSEPGPTMTALEPGPGGGEEIVEFTIPPMFFAVLVGVLIVWASSYVVKARVHFVDPEAYITRDNQGRQVYVDFSFTWQIENISRWLLVAMTRTDIAGRLRTEIHSAMALVTSYSCEGADCRRQKIARLVTKTVNSSIVPRYGATCQV
ncbi:hypothetical protein L6258_03985, partial [Candidatus Parcubacteria bacterium]|nr:hypothetical protein [Candidatus Parcubacteria bacterium]